MVLVSIEVFRNAASIVDRAQGATNKAIGVLDVAQKAFEEKDDKRKELNVAAHKLLQSVANVVD